MGPKRSRNEGSSSSNPTYSFHSFCFVTNKEVEEFNDRYSTFPVRVERQLDKKILTSTEFRFQYLDLLREWKFLEMMQIPSVVYQNLVRVFFCNARRNYSDDRKYVVSLTSSVMGTEFTLDPQSIAEFLGLENIGLDNEDAPTGLPYRPSEKASVLDIHDRFLHLLVSWWFRPSGGKYSKFRNVDIWWIHCFRERQRINLASIIFADLVWSKDHFNRLCTSFPYGCVLSYIFTKLHIDTSYDTGTSLSKPIGLQSLRQAGWANNGGIWRRKEPIPPPPINSEDEEAQGEQQAPMPPQNQGDVPHYIRDIMTSINGLQVNLQAHRTHFDTVQQGNVSRFNHLTGGMDVLHTEMQGIRGDIATVTQRQDEIIEMLRAFGGRFPPPPPER